jgi:hypothetical protein
MERFQQTIVARGVLDGGWRTGRRDQRRVMSATELDEIADFTWRLLAPTRAVAAYANALRASWRFGSSARRDESPAASAEAQHAA